MAGGRKIKLSRPKGLRLSNSGKFGLWAGLTVLLTLGTLTTVLDLLEVPTAQTRHANEDRQRAVIDPATGVVSIGTPEEAQEKFDVGTEPAEKSETTGTTTPEATGDVKPEETPEAAATEATPDAKLPTNTPTLRTAPLAADVKTPDFSKYSLVSAPAPEITETIDTLRLPKRGIKDATASAIYAQPFKRKPEQVLLSFVVMDVGLDSQSIGMLLDLPKEVTIAYSPYAHNAGTYSESFRRMGHELWTMLPSMGERFPTDDPGPMGMITRMPKEELVRRMHEVMGAVVGSVGMILPPDEAVTPDKESTATILGELSERGLLLVSTHPTHAVDQITADKKLAEIIRRADMVLDPTADESQITSKLAGLIAAATQKGEYIVVMSARPQTVNIVRDWLKQTTLPAPIALAPLSAFYQPRIAPVKAEEKAGEHGEAPKAEDAPKEESHDEKKPDEAKKPDEHH